MKSLLLLLGSLALVTSLFVGGLAITQTMVAEPAPHQFAHLDAPDLWTSAPVKVDGSRQSYERVPGIALVASIPASDVPQLPKGGDTQTAALTEAPASDTADQVADRGAPVDTAQADWCSARYRSYRAEDNSYQPFSGGPRRQCQAPGSHFEQSASASGLVRQTSAPGGDDVQTMASAELMSDGSGASSARSGMMDGSQSRSHAEWCMDRYRSYRMEDNSYQPLDGGPRRSCQSPFG